MRTASFGKLIALSFDRTLLILFRPFSFRKWLALLLIAFVAGALSWGGGGGGGTGGGGRDKKADAAIEQVADPEKTPKVAPAGNPVMDKLKKIDERWAGLWRTWKVQLVIGFVVLVLVSVILWTWLSCRFSFIWYEAILKNSVSIREPFGRYAALGNSLFWADLIILLGVLAYFGAMLGGFAWLAFKAGMFTKGFGWSWSTGLFMLGAPLAMLAVSVVALVLFMIGIVDFIIPMMALDNVGFWPALKSFSTLYAAHRWDICLYFLVKLGLSILTGIGEFVVAMVLVIAGLIAAIGLFGLGYLFYWLIAVNLHAPIVFWAIAGGVLVPIVLAGLLVLASISLPAAVFFRCFSLYFLSSLGGGYQPLVVDRSTNSGIISN